MPRSAARSAEKRVRDKLIAQEVRKRVKQIKQKQREIQAMKIANPMLMQIPDYFQQQLRLQVSAQMRQQLQFQMQQQFQQRCQANIKQQLQHQMQQQMQHQAQLQMHQKVMAQRQKVLASQTHSLGPPTNSAQIPAEGVSAPAVHLADSSSSAIPSMQGVRHEEARNVPQTGGQSPFGGQDVHTFLRKLALMAPPQNVADSEISQMAAHVSTPSGLPPGVIRKIWGAKQVREAKSTSNVYCFDERGNTAIADGYCWAQCGICRSWRSASRELVNKIAAAKHEIFLCQRTGYKCTDAMSLRASCIQSQTEIQSPVQLLSADHEASLAAHNPQCLYLEQPKLNAIATNFPLGAGTSHPNAAHMPMPRAPTVNPLDAQVLTTTLKDDYGFTITMEDAFKMASQYHQVPNPKKPLVNFVVDSLNLRRSEASPSNATKSRGAKMRLEPVVAKVIRKAPRRINIQKIVNGLRQKRALSVLQSLRQSKQPSVPAHDATNEEGVASWVVSL